MFPQEWRPILQSMVQIYPQGCTLGLIGRSTDLDTYVVKRTVRDLTARGFIALDASDKDGRMLRLTEAGTGRGLRPCGQSRSARSGERAGIGRAAGNVALPRPALRLWPAELSGPKRRPCGASSGRGVHLV